MRMQILSKYYARFKSEVQFFFLFLIFTSAKPRPMKNDIWQFLGLEFVNINKYAKFYQNIPHGSRDSASFTFSEFGPRQNLDQLQMAFGNPLGWILPISTCM